MTNILTNRPRTDRRIYSHSADPRAEEDYSTDPRVVQDSHSDNSAAQSGMQ